MPNSMDYEVLDRFIRDLYPAILKEVLKYNLNTFKNVYGFVE